MKIRAIGAELWSLPLRAPFAISQRTAYTAENVFIFVEASDTVDSLPLARGGLGWGSDSLPFREGLGVGPHSGSPFPNRGGGWGEGSITGFGASAPVAYVTGETTESVLEAVLAVRGKLGLDLTDLDRLLSVIQENLLGAPAARAGLEMAVFDAWAKSSGVALWQHFGGAVTGIDTDLTIPITSPTVAGELAREAAQAGFGTLKIKVGSCDGPDADLDRIRAVVSATPGVRIRIDANQAFTPEAAIDFAARLSTTGAIVEMIEQPVTRGDIDGLKAVRDAIDYPLFADEAACSPADVRELLARDAVDGVNIKLMKSGIAGALQIIDLCRNAGKKLMIGCMLETELGIAAAAQIAAGTGAFDHADLDSHRLLSPVPRITGGLRHEGEKLTVDVDGGFGWGVSVARLEA